MTFPVRLRARVPTNKLLRSPGLEGQFHGLVMRVCGQLQIHNYQLTNASIHTISEVYVCRHSPHMQTGKHDGSILTAGRRHALFIVFS